MLARFDQKPGVDFCSFETAYGEFFDCLKGTWLVETSGKIGYRQNGTSMDKDNESKEPDFCCRQKHWHEAFGQARRRSVRLWR